MKHALRHAGLLAAVCLAFGPHLAHAAGNAIEVSARLSKLAYTLSDLDTSDTLGPGISFEPKDYEGTVLSLSDVAMTGSVTRYDQAMSYGSVFSSPNKSVNDATGMAVKNGTTLSAKAVYSVAEAKSLLNGPYRPDAGLNESLIFHNRGAEAGISGSLGGLVGLAFTLAPNTSVTFTGQVDLSAAIDASWLPASDAFARARAGGGSITLFGYGVGEIGIQHPFENILHNGPLPTDGAQSASGANDFRVTIAPNGALTWEGSAAPVSKQLSVTYSNLSTQSAQKVFYYDASSQVFLGVTAVPEPGTWALMALGLAGLGLAGRARQKP